MNEEGRTIIAQETLYSGTVIEMSIGRNTYVLEVLEIVDREIL